MMEDTPDIGTDSHLEDSSLADKKDDDVNVNDNDNKSLALEPQNPITEIDNKQSSLSTENSDDLTAHQPKPVDDRSPMDEDGSMEPETNATAQTQTETETTGDVIISAHTNDDMQGNTESNDGATASLDATNQSAPVPVSVSVSTNESMEEANTLVENGNEVKNVVTSATAMAESPTNSGTKEEDLTNALKIDESPLVCDVKVQGMNEGVDSMDVLPYDKAQEEQSDERMAGMERLIHNETKEELSRQEMDTELEDDLKPPQNSFLLEPDVDEGYESGTEMDQLSFMKELETFHKENYLEFKPVKFYGVPLNCLKLWRSVIRLGGYEQVTSCKLWRQVGESFKPPKTCTTVSWTFRCFYEKALLEYEKYKMRMGELPFTDVPFTGAAAAGNQASVNQASGSGRARRDAAARAMQGWHSQRLLSNGEVGDPIIKDKNSSSLRKREKQLKSIGLLKRKKPSPVERAVNVSHMRASRMGSMVVDVGPPADWVKINVQRTKDCFEVYALVPGLLREEVHVQSDPAGRLVITGQPEQLDNHWGVTPFKKIVSLPSRIDPHQTSAVVTLHGQLFVRVPFEPLDHLL